MSEIRLTKQSYVYILLLFVYRILLDYSYVYVISIRYSYDGLISNPSEERYLISWVVFLCSFPFFQHCLNEEDEQASSYIILFLYLMSFVPSTTCYYAGLLSGECMILLTIYYYMLFLFHKIVCCQPVKKKILIKIGDIEIHDKVAYYVAVITILTIIYISYKYTGFRLNFNFRILYDIREEAAGYNLPVSVSYIFSISRMILPMMLGYCIIYKQYAFGVLIICAQVLSFSINGMKTVLFIPIVVGVIVYLHRKFRIAQSKKFIIIGALSIVFLGIVENFVNGTITIDGTFIRRVFFVPIRLHEIYYKFFSINEVDFFRSSFLRHLGITSPYNALGGIPHSIAVYLGNPGGHPNNGLFSDAFANFWGVGIVIMPLVLVMIFRLFDKCSFGIYRELIIATSLQFSFLIISSSVGTAMIGHGMFLTMILFAFMKKTNK